MNETVYRRTVPLMGTLVTIDVVGGAAGHRAHASNQLEEAVERAFGWFQQVEECCTRFDPQSELARLSAHVGVAVRASPILYEAVQFALAVAEESGGAFDPTVGAAMESRGFNREYRVAVRPVRTAPAHSNSATYPRDVRLDPRRKTITLLRPLLLDLGAVAKGLAIDMAAHELRPFENFAINAGGDIYVGGHNPRGGPWSPSWNPVIRAFPARCSIPFRFPIAPCAPRAITSAAAPPKAKPRSAAITSSILAWPARDFRRTQP